MNIMLVCSAGMSTSMLVTKMQEAAKTQGVEATIWAIPEAEIQTQVQKADVILLGPQVRFLMDKIKTAAAPYNTPVELINTMHYGLMNGEEVLKQAQTLAK